MKKAFLIFLALLSSFAISIPAAPFSPSQQAIPAEYHVDPSGNDSNPGSSSAPWRTVQHAADSAVPGDTVVIHNGAYREEVVFRYSGTAETPITFSGAPDETAILEGLEFAAGAAHLVVSDLRIEGGSVWRVWLRGNNHHITIEGSTIIGGETGVRITWGDSGHPPVDGPVSDIHIEDCIIQGQVYTAVDCTPGPGNRLTFRNLDISGPVGGEEPSFAADGIAVERGNNILVEDCYIHDILGDGIDLNSRDTQGHIPGIEVRRNVVARARQNGIKIWAGGRVENNVVWGSGIAPLVIGIFAGSYAIVNNTIAFNMWDPGYSGRDYSFVASYPENEDSAEIDLVLLNNIFAFNTGPRVGTPTGIYLGEGVNLLKEDNNLYWSRDDCEITAEFVRGDPDISRSEIEDGTWTRISGQGKNNILSDPIFVNGWPDVVLYLDEKSPAIDTGTSENAPGDDCEGMMRPAGIGYDIGAYEYGAEKDQESNGDESEDPGNKDPGLEDPKPKRTEKRNIIK